MRASGNGGPGHQTGRAGGIWRALRPQRGSFRGEVVESFLTNLGITGTSVVTGILLARLLGPDGRGELAAIQALPVIVGAFGMLGLQDAVIYFGAREPRRIGPHAVTATLLIILAGIPIFLLGRWATPYLLHAQSDRVVLASQLYLGLLFVNAINTLSITTARAAHKISVWNKLRVIPSILWILVILLLHAAGSLGPVSVALTYLAAILAAAWLAILATRRYFREAWRPRLSLCAPMLRYGLPLAVGGTPRILNQRVDQLIIAGLLASRDLGFYAVAVSWSSLMLLPGTALSAVAFSKIAGVHEARSQAGLVRRVAWGTAIASVGAAVVLVASAPLAIPWVFGRRFEVAVPVAMILTVASGLRSLSQTLQVGMMGVGRPSAVMISEWGGLVTLLAAIFVMIPTFGLAGAAWSVVLSNVVCLALVFRLYRNWSGKIPFDDPPRGGEQGQAGKGSGLQ